MILNLNCFILIIILKAKKKIQGHKIADAVEQIEVLRN